MRPSASRRPRLSRVLLDAASEPYRRAGRFAWHFARGKLSSDPAFGAIVGEGWIAPGARVLDLGCGQGLLAALLEAQDLDCRFRGIELMSRDVDRARAALHRDADARRAERIVFVQGDIRTADFGRADVAVILDVLHYIDYAAQDAVIARLRDALDDDGLLLLRIGDASAGLPFRISNWVDRVVTFVRGHRLGRLWCRPLADWEAVLRSHGFVVHAIPLSQGTPFANVMLHARASPRHGGASPGSSAAAC
ncbi:MAG: trans-aconitate 2-methyltransferase [Lautropia sp.]